MGHFDGKTVVVTGAGGGIGRCHALAFAKEGANVIVNDPGKTLDGRQPKANAANVVAEEIRQAGGNAIADRHSVAERSGARAIIQAAIDAFGGIDILVNNAGILRDRTLAKMSDEEWDAVIGVHLRGTYLCTQEACRQMINQGRGGAIVNTSSTSGLFGNFGQGNYGAAKAGIAGFTKVAALEMLKHRIRVNAIAPTAKTRMTENLPQVSSALLPEHISPLVLYLASDKASGVTGRIFAAQGNHLQEFYYATTPGLKKEDRAELWTIDEIAEHWDAITNRQTDHFAESVLSDLESLLTAGLPQKFNSAKAADLNMTLYFHVKDGQDYTVIIKNGEMAVEKGRRNHPTSIISGDARTILRTLQGKENLPDAYRSGFIKITNGKEVLQFQNTLT